MPIVAPKSNQNKKIEYKANSWKKKNKCFDT